MKACVMMLRWRTVKDQGTGKAAWMQTRACPAVRSPLVMKNVKVFVKLEPNEQRATTAVGGVQQCRKCNICQIRHFPCNPAAIKARKKLNPTVTCRGVVDANLRQFTLCYFLVETCQRQIETESRTSFIVLFDISYIFLCICINMSNQYFVNGMIK